MADIIPFPSRAQPRVAHVHAREAQPPRGELMKWHDADFRGLPGDWVVDWWANSDDSVCMMGRFTTEADADEFIREWDRDHPHRPDGAA